MDDIVMMLGGSQTITTLDGIIFPLVVKNGLCYLEQHKPTTLEMRLLPRVIMTLAKPWDPTTNDKNNNVKHKMLSKLNQTFTWPIEKLEAFSTNVDTGHEKGSSAGRDNEPSTATT